MEAWSNCHLEELKCVCQGEGWIHTGPSFEECPIHFEGQLHPDTKALLLDDNRALKEEQRKSKIKWQINQNHSTISYLEHKLYQLKNDNIKLQSDLIQKATTVKMKAVRLQEEIRQVNVE